MNATLPGSGLKDFSRILACLAKIGDEVSLEVRPDTLLLSTLNQSKSAFLLVTLHNKRFEKYEFVPLVRRAKTEETDLRCKLQLRALLSIFRPRNIENKESREGSVEKCEFKLLHPSKDIAECQLLIRLVCKHGVKKTYKLQYEITQTMHAITDKSTSLNRFNIPAQALKDVMDHFAPRAEELTLTVEKGDLLLTSFTEGILNEKEVLKQPIHTSVCIDAKEFYSMDVDEQLQITFGLREFKSIVSLCDLLSADLEVYYGDPGRPLIVEFEKDGMNFEFVVATTSDDDNYKHPQTSTRFVSRTDEQHAARLKSTDRASMNNTMVGNDPAQSPMPPWHDQSIAVQSGQRSSDRDTPLASDIPPKIADQGAPLFLPDHDGNSSPSKSQESRFAGNARSAFHDRNGLEDDGIYRLANAYAHEESMGTKDQRAEEYGDDTMELFEDHQVFDQDADDTLLGPTQAPNERMKSIFD